MGGGLHVQLRLAFFAISIGAATIAMIAASAIMSPSHSVIALLEPISQGVFMRTAAMGTDARVGDHALLRSGDAVRTDATGRAFITYADGTIFVVEPNTDLVIDVRVRDTDLLVLITQNAGRVWYQIARSLIPGARYEVHSGSLAAVVRAGSIVSVVVTDEGASVTTASGAADASSSGQTVTVTSGTRTTVRPDSTPAPLVPAAATPEPLPAPLYQWPAATQPTAALAATPLSTATPEPVGALPLPTIPAVSPAPTPTVVPAPPPTTPSPKTKPTQKPKPTPTPAASIGM